uniref:BSD domain-containing protein n=1 Tax=Heterorhabditis bacteriophora TaxID=37862 RepID=A0A1I7XFQ3_HETBA
MSGEQSLYSMVTEEPGKTCETPNPSHIEEDRDEPSISTFPTASSWLTAGTSWGSSWFNSAKEKTMSTLDLVKKDLSEFTEAMSQEVNDLTSAAKGGIDNAANVVKKQAHYLEKLVVPEQEDSNSLTDMKERDASCDNIKEEETIAAKVEKSATVGFEWMMSIVDSVADTVKTFAIEETTQGEDEITELINPKLTRRTRINPVRLSEIQNSEVTYLNEPENKDAFAQWISRFSMDEHDGEINMLLGNNPHMRQIYSTLVPSQLDAVTFWSRYFFTVQLAEMDEEMKQPFILQDISVKTEQKLTRKDPSPKTESDSDGSMTVLEQPTSPAQSTDDWSVCSEKNDVEEVANNNVETGPVTPRAKDDFCNESSQNSNKKEDGWVNWDE